jgi:hypothetical protein
MRTTRIHPAAIRPTRPNTAFTELRIEAPSFPSLPKNKTTSTSHYNDQVDHVVDYSVTTWGQIE